MTKSRHRYLPNWFLSAFVLCVSFCFWKAAFADSFMHESSIITPGLTSSLASDSLAPRQNPAGLGYIEGAELQLTHLRTRQLRSTGMHYAAALGAIAFGFSNEWLEGQALSREQRSLFTLAAGDRGFSVGASMRWLRFRDEKRHLASYDLGAAGRLHPWFAWALAAQDLGLSNRTSYSAGVGIRAPNDRLTVGLDRIVRSGQSFIALDGLLSWALALRLSRGLTLSTQLIHPLTEGLNEALAFRLALTFDLPNSGLTLGLAPRGRPAEDAYAALRFSTARHISLPIPHQRALINLENQLQAPESLLLSTLARDPFIDLIRLLDQARRDPEIDSLVIRTSGRALLSFSQAEELRRSIELIRNDGKSVFFYLDGATDSTLYLASAADAIIAAPTATIAAGGIAITATFFAETLEKIGVTPQFVRAGEYKTAPDSFERRDMSDAQQEATTDILDDVFQRYVNATSNDLGISDGELILALDRGVYTAREAMDGGLIDSLAYPDELASELSSSGRDLEIVQDYHKRSFANTRWGKPPRIAIVPVTGTIIHGETPSGLFRSSDTTGSITVVRAIKQALEDEAVVAIVVRIDSPGGEAYAADLIWRALREADEIKPVVASMGSVAASGGYYVAAGTRHIVATPSTITGSIGVFSGGFALSELFGKIGVNRVTLKHGDKADLFGMDRIWREEDRAALQSHVDSAYADFINRVALGRDMDLEQVEKAAGGRIWTGALAKDKGLIDQLGAFHDAVAYAKKAAGIRENRVVDISLYNGFTGMPLAFSGRGRPLADRYIGHHAPSPIEELLHLISPAFLLRPELPLALMPFTIEIK